MRITLDRVALKALIDADPEFELQLKTAVLSEVGRRFFEKDAKRIIEANQGDMFRQAVASLQNDEDAREMVNRALKAAITVRAAYSSFSVKPDVLREIEKHVEQRKKGVIDSAAAQIGMAFNDAIEKALADKLAEADIDARIEKRVNRLIEEEIDRRAKEKFDARMAELKGMLG